MKPLYIVTGACGHLGNTIVRQLIQKGEHVRGLRLPSESPDLFEGLDFPLIAGDVRDADSLEPLFEGVEKDQPVVVIHTAGIICITRQTPKNAYQVNVEGTKNLIDQCLSHHVQKLVYVSSVHAIPEKEDWQVIREINHFDPQAVVGGYAKTKAEATQAVLDAVKRGLNAVVVHPSGIIGPCDYGHNHLMEMIRSYLSGKLPACVRGGYDFVDVRDVAKGCILAAEKGKTGECYILSNRHYDIPEVMRMLKSLCGKRRVPPALPMGFAKMAAPFMEWHAKAQKRTPLFTGYSLHTLRSNDKFSHEKASRDLGYSPRDLYQTLKDTVAWMAGKKTAVLKHR